MKSIILFCALLALELHSSVASPFKTLENSVVSIDATGSITNNDIEGITGTVKVQQNPFSIGLSRSSSNALSALLGYAVTTTGESSSAVTAVTAQTQIGSNQIAGSVNLDLAPINGITTTALASLAATKEGVTNYGIGLGANSNHVKTNVQVTGTPKNGVSLKGTATVGPVTGLVTRNTAGLWDEQVKSELLLIKNPKIVLLGKLHRDTSNQVTYILGIQTLPIQAQISVNPNNILDYNLKGSGSGVQNNIAYSFSGSLSYLGGSKVTPYDASLTVGPVTGKITGQLFNYYSASIALKFNVLGVTLSVSAQGDVSIDFSLRLDNAKLELALDGNLNPTTLAGNVWTDSLNFKVQTDFKGDYNFSFNDQVMTLSL